MCAHREGANVGGFGCQQEGHLAWGLLGGVLKALVKKNENHVKSYQKRIISNFWIVVIVQLFPNDYMLD